MNLEQLKHVHIIGVCGTLMGAFAAFLKRKGVHVTGSDQHVYPPMSDVLSQAGVELLSGYRSENLTRFDARPDLVVIGNVIRADNPEARYAIDQGYAYTSLPEAMEKLILVNTRNLVVAGTHGKTTTSSILAHILVKAGFDPGYFIGGVSKDLPFSFQVSKTDLGVPFVLEGDEYDTAFWDKVPKFNHYLPVDTILTSVEYDHADIYPDFQSVLRAFEGLLSRIQKQGHLIACVDYDSIRGLISAPEFQARKIPVLTYGSYGARDARFTADRVRMEGEFTCFDVLDMGQKVAELRIQVPGQHNVLNALSVWIQCCELMKVSAEVFREALQSFQGVKRRQEVRGKVRGIIVMDDFAHHPTAVRETLKALKMKYPEKRLITVFEPRSATSRRKIFQKDYGEAFEPADQIFIAAPFDQTRIDTDNQFSSEQLVGDLTLKGKVARVFHDVDQGVKMVTQELRSGDLVAVLSNGSFDGFIAKLLGSL